MDNNSKLNIKEFLDKDEQKDLLRFLTAGSVDDGKSTLDCSSTARKSTKTNSTPSSATANVWETPESISIMPCCSTD